MPTSKDILELPHGETEGKATHGRRVYYLDDIVEDASGFVTVPLPTGRGAVKVRGMTGAEENLFGQDSRENPLYPMEETVRRCVLDGANVLKEDYFLISDYLFLTWVIRRLTYGDIFNFEYTCPSCRNKSPYKLDLSTVEVIHASPADEQVYRSPEGFFTYRMPRSGNVVAYVMPTLMMQRRNVKLLQEKRETMVTEALRSCVRHVVEGPHPNLYALGEIWQTLPSMDIKGFDADMDRHNVGINTSVRVNCPKCLTRDDIDLPIRSMDFLVSSGDIEPRPDGRWSTFSASPPATS